ncbi:CPBP family intramembrane metalloprotease [Natronococcus sp. JC468]|uniref:CPBP family glutamic-type intramembrane protease n=1 Tax=Natronococcus sp. JC468 TaxID=1961921 RepID=UPI00143AE2C1|nr:CPBP family glutamic-type intramembrane protease [Natronococcus sp. JC468]NKE34870.1 CPBP family intramembrane metalloprotease [Natronococcus sp. JC468]
MTAEDGRGEVGRLPGSLAGLTWFQKSLLTGAVLTVLWTQLVPPDLGRRVVVDSILLIGGPLALGLTHGNHIGWNVDRTAVRNAALLSLFVLPFYLVGSTLPTIRAFYPMWETSAAPGEFLPHAIKLFALALAAETYYRGLLCVGVREIGFKAVLISPVVYMLHHASKPPLEFLLSGPTDVLFGAVDYTSDSILPSVIAHGAGLVLLDWLVLHDPLFDPADVLARLEWLPIPL